MRVRPADPDRDAAACAAIYAPHVEPGPASFEEHAPDAAEIARRMRVAHAWLVAEEDGAVAGYAYASPHRDRAAYRWAVDVAVYVGDAFMRRGVGRALYAALLPLLAERGFRAACAGIALPNDASVRLHEAFGFELVGVYRRIGFKAGAWRDVGWWQLDLARGDDSPPLELKG
jgi:phosphinothricin acetyltransferase